MQTDFSDFRLLRKEKMQTDFSDFRLDFLFPEKRKDANRL